MFPLLYHAHHSRHMEDLAFWRQLAQKHPEAQLELGCGTGRLLIPLLQAGCNIMGMDHDLEMLRYLRQNLLPELSSRAIIFQGDFTAFQIDKSFDLIFLPCNTYSTLTPEQRLALLSCCKTHINLGGIFAASLPNPEVLRRLPRRSETQIEEFFLHPIDGEPVQVSSGWQRQGQEIDFDWHYDHLHPEGSVSRVSIQIRHCLQSLTVYHQELQQVGFASLQTYGDYDWTPYQNTSPHLILVARH